MAETAGAGSSSAGGIQVDCQGRQDALAVGRHLVDCLAGTPLADALQLDFDDRHHRVIATLPATARDALAPVHDTLGLAARLGLPAPQGGPRCRASDHALDLEITAALLLGPAMQCFPSPAELASAVRIRAHAARAAWLTCLEFDPRAVQRPVDCWVYDEDRGFVVRQGVSLTEALRKATQPGVSGTRYAFSCYRASEYVLLLGLAEELQVCNPPLYQALDALWHRRAIASGEFHGVFLSESGSSAEPLPPRWYVPGDRIWFRNPDPVSADASGYEGSWVIYLGHGLFSNFWQHDRPFDFDGKCLEIYHWRDAVFQDAAGETRIDEARVAEHVAATQRNPAERARVLARMQRYRDVRGVYAQGGCIDSTREQLRWVCPGTATLALPAS
jgi:hypothetical protein